MKEILFILLFAPVTFNFKLAAQAPTFIPMDENFALVQKFYDTDTVIVIMPDSEPISAMEQKEIENFMFWGTKPVFIFKKESDLKPNDHKKHLQLFGAIFNFKNNYSALPTRIIEDGFIYNTNSFTKENDAFYYLNDGANVLYTCKNATNTLTPFSIYGIGAYQLYIYSDYDIYYSGFPNPNTSDENVNNIKELKSEYFQLKTTLFFNLHIAKTLNVDSIHLALSNVLDNYVMNLCMLLEVDTCHLKKMNLYLYANRIELQKFIAAPLWSTVWGKCMGNVLHTEKVNLAAIKHETAHSIIFQKIGFYSNPFFDEGFRQYTEYWFNHEAYHDDLSKTKTHPELLDKQLVKGDNTFFSNSDNYAVSGVFIKYIIDKIGYDDFKTGFSQRMIEEILTTKYNMSIDDLIKEAKHRLLLPCHSVSYQSSMQIAE